MVYGDDVQLGRVMDVFRDQNKGRENKLALLALTRAQLNIQT